jgi:hypothetical protein
MSQQTIHDNCTQCEQSNHQDQYGNNVSVKAEKVFLHDMVKTAVMGVQAIDVVEEYIVNPEFKSFVVHQKDQYRHFSSIVNDYMREHGIEEDFYGSVEQAINKGMLKMGAMGTNSDSRVAEQLIKGSNMGLDTLSKNINNPKGVSVQLLNITKDFVTFMNDSLQELRKWL